MPLFRQVDEDIEHLGRGENEMQLIKPDINIDFMGTEEILGLSVIVVLSCVLSLVVQGLNLGIDFAEEPN